MTIAHNLDEIQARMLQSAIAANRAPGSTRLVAISKKQPCSKIVEAAAAGLHDFGESYLQEALPKIEALRALSLCWHFIGPIQSNKTKSIARAFSWVHSVCRENIAFRLNNERPENLPPLNVCIQVNLDHETTKSGTSPELVADLARYILQLPRLRLRGLMCIPNPNDDRQTLERAFMHLNDLFCTVNTHIKVPMDTLSMGMTDDLEPAIHAGSTMVRVGRGIFGVR